MFDKSKIGHSFPPFTIEVERVKIRELALAIGDDNPIYQSREAAQAAGYPDVPLYPTAPIMFNFWGNSKMGEQLASLGISFTHILHSEEEYQYLAPINTGDTLTGITTVIDGKSRQGMDIVTLEIRYTNQHNQPVLNAREMFVVRE